ncbi:MAG TPA: glucose-6-phosphate dehydrogenase assembly protein OpcA [candidate division Zixibacteria bacterium]|nr:glucose-6-phosphate dehydrogenase assembly protein OpcA [candidate division Zixibacteria bacterium]
MSSARPARDDAAQQDITLHRHLMRFGEAESSVAPVWTATNTTVREVEAHLSRLWSMTGLEDDALVTEKGLPHSRASVLNLIVTVPDAAAAERVVRTMLGLGFRHPSRAIVLVVDPKAPGDGLDASVSAHCHPTAGDGDQVCYEEVVLTVRGEAAAHLNGLVAPLLIHDLPTIVWWPGPPPFADPTFDQLVELSDRLIVDSSDFGNLLVGLRRMVGLRRRAGIGDLTWKRLAWWQELTAQFFDAPRFRRYLPNLNGVRLQYALPAGTDAARSSAAARASPISQALLYAGWIASRLEWRRYATVEPLTDGSLRLTLEGRYAMVDLRIEGVPRADVPPGELVALRLRARGETGAAEFIADRHGEEATVASNADGMTALLRRVRMEPPSESELLAMSLLLERHDELYEPALRAATIFLASAQRAEQ